MALMMQLSPNMRILFAALTLLSTQSFADFRATCPVNLKDLLAARAYLTCKLPSGSSHCGHALGAAGLMHPGVETKLKSNEILQVEAVLNSTEDWAMVALGYSEWIAEKVADIQPRISTQNLKTFLSRLNSIKATSSQIEKSAREGLQRLADNAFSPSIPIESTVFWLRSIPAKNEALPILIDPALPQEKAQVLAEFLTDSGQAANIGKELQRLSKAGIKPDGAQFWEPETLNRLGTAATEFVKLTGVLAADSLVVLMGRQTLKEVGYSLSAKLGQVGFRVSTHSFVNRQVSLALQSFVEARVTRYLTAHGLMFILSNLEPPGILLTALDLTMRVTPTACSTLDRAALPVDESCRILKDNDTHPNVLRFLDLLNSKDQGTREYVQDLLKFPETCSFYQDLSSKARRQPPLRNLECKRLEIRTDITIENKKYGLSIRLYPENSRNPGSIRQVIANMENASGTKKNAHFNLVYDSKGNITAADGGEDDDIQAVILIASLRAAQLCDAK